MTVYKFRVIENKPSYIEFVAYLNVNTDSEFIEMLRESFNNDNGFNLTDAEILKALYDRIGKTMEYPLYSPSSVQDTAT